MTNTEKAICLYACYHYFVETFDLAVKSFREDLPRHKQLALGSIFSRELIKYVHLKLNQLNLNKSEIPVLQINTLKSNSKELEEMAMASEYFKWLEGVSKDLTGMLIKHERI